MSLLRESNLVALRRMTKKLMKTRVAIYKFTAVDNDYSDEGSESFTYSTTVDGWLRSMPSDGVDVAYGQTSVHATHRLFVPVGTDIAAFDKVIIAGKAYKVIDTGAESTYQVLIRVSLRKSE